MSGAGSDAHLVPPAPLTPRHCDRAVLRRRFGGVTSRRSHTDAMTNDAGSPAGVGEAFEAVPRRGFLPRGSRHLASYDGPIPIGKGQTNSQPRAVRSMLELLAVEPGHRVLDVGAGSGWTTALLAHLTGPDGTVLGVELEPDAGALRLGEPGQRRAALGVDPRTPRRVCWASRTRLRSTGSWCLPTPGSCPDELVDQLDDQGRLVVPVNSTMLLVTRTGDEIDVSQHGAYRFVPLRLDHEPEQQHEDQPADREHRLHQRPRLDGLADREAEVLLDQPEAGVVDVGEEHRAGTDRQHDE